MTPVVNSGCAVHHVRSPLENKMLSILQEFGSKDFELLLGLEYTRWRL